MWVNDVVASYVIEFHPPTVVPNNAWNAYYNDWADWNTCTRGYVILKGTGSIGRIFDAIQQGRPVGPDCYEYSSPETYLCDLIYNMRQAYLDEKNKKIHRKYNKNGLDF